ncbi:hypothetical protein SPRG_03543 [Saprolegnia parasitica CBS 223.65]|uniref:Uncharacterized protein n=1 Tax=Saprolegnia parasitica (strain CBS 223.65) TaxID=695850 RepID=A0A067CM91_SAPPC|nr:hypothetical protein SPRG_03543 [Saprolegnia parasitica CBS 223.65]KDO31623.1 hypothetical protein SPRG_03543 [Saprolegnia parasitica CBS 223.65]|eukprot:XP_012197513.1 hypothetical protein SPRG_03543 [Saprolegnia parasitica CBS 223.65]
MISLAHVKSSQAEAEKAVPTRRIAWPGGNLVSNKEEALRKFMERKKAIAEGRSTSSSASASPSKASSHQTTFHVNGRKRTVGHKVQPHGPSKALHTKKRDYKHTMKDTVTFKSTNVKAAASSKGKASAKPLPTVSKLSMSLDDIVRKSSK